MNKTNYCTDLIEKIPDCRYFSDLVKFRLPDNGLILNLKNKSSISETYINYIPILKLPYAQVLFEFPVVDKINSEIPVVLYARQVADNQVQIKTYIRLSADFWDLCDFEVNIRLGSEIEIKSTAKNSIEINLSNYITKVALNVCAALCCSNIDIISDEFPPEKLNKSRLKKGKQPLFAYKVISLLRYGNKLSASGAGKTVKTHLRRGHIRRLQGKTIWVNSAIVNFGVSTDFQKEYRIKALK